MHKASLLFIFEPCQGSKVRCLHSAPVRAVRGPPDLVRRLALLFHAVTDLHQSIYYR